MSSVFLFVLLAGIGCLFSLAYLSERGAYPAWLVYLALAPVNLGAVAVGVPYTLAAWVVPDLDTMVADAMRTMGFAPSASGGAVATRLAKRS